MGTGPITNDFFGQAIPDHFDSACFEIPSGTSAREEPTIISSTADKALELIDADTPKNGTDIAIFGDHNYSYYFWHLARLKERLKEGSSLLHFDAHPDIKSSGPRPMPPDNRYPMDIFRKHAQWLTIANFIGDATVSGLLDEFNWVLPEWACEGSIVGDQYWSYLNGTSTIYSPDDTIFFGHCMNEEGFEVMPIRDMGECKNIDKPFLAKKHYLSGIPEMAGKDVVLDIDLDWFCNSGWDSGTFTRSIKHDCDVNIVDSMMRVLKEKGVTPATVTIATSPEYMFTDRGDDILYAIVKGLIDYGIVDAPRLIIGPPAYSMNTQYFAESLFNFVYDNMLNDPRLNAELSDVTGFNSENMVCKLRTLDEAKGHQHDRVKNLNDDIYYPGLKNVSEETFSCQRGDYSLYISIADEQGLVLLKKMLEHLQFIQTNKYSDPVVLRVAYEMVIYLIRPMTRNLLDARLEPNVLY